MPYLATLERELRGCKIVVDDSCASQRLSTAIFYFNFYKNTEIQRGKELTLNPCLRNPSFLEPQLPRTLALVVVVQKVIEEKEEEEERKKEEDGASPCCRCAESRSMKGRNRKKERRRRKRKK